MEMINRKPDPLYSVKLMRVLPSLHSACCIHKLDSIRIKFNNCQRNELICIGQQPTAIVHIHNVGMEIHLINCCCMR